MTHNESVARADELLDAVKDRREAAAKRLLAADSKYKSYKAGPKRTTR